VNRDRLPRRNDASADYGSGACSSGTGSLVAKRRRAYIWFESQLENLRKSKSCVQCLENGHVRPQHRNKLTLAHKAKKRILSPIAGVTVRGRFAKTAMMADRTSLGRARNRVDWRSTLRSAATAKRRWERDIIRLLTLRKWAGTAFGTARLIEFALSIVVR
jgi:hypothetical protein